GRSAPTRRQELVQDRSPIKKRPAPVRAPAVAQVALPFLPTLWTARSALAILSLVDTQRSSAKRLAVQVLNRARGVRTGHLDKSEASRLAGVTVGDQTDRFNGSVFREQLADVALTGGERQVSYIDLHTLIKLNNMGRCRPKNTCAANNRGITARRRRAATWIGNTSTLLDSAVRRADGARHTAGKEKRSRAEPHDAGADRENKGRTLRASSLSSLVCFSIASRSSARRMTICRVRSRSNAGARRRPR